MSIVAGYHTKISNLSKSIKFFKICRSKVCVCSNGRLFLSPPDGSCVADATICG